jgi:small redox-active disulfide protein 2
VKEVVMSTDIRILGPGCFRCQALYENTLLAVSDLGLDAEVTKVEDIGEMLSRGIMATPALVVDDDLVMAGSVPTPQRLGELLREHLATRTDP